MTRRPTSGKGALLVGCFSAAVLFLMTCAGVGVVTCRGLKRELAKRADAAASPDDEMPMSSSPPGPLDAPVLERSTGECAPFDGERRQPRFVDSRDFGSAKRLRGRTAVLHALVGTVGHDFTRSDMERVKSSVALSREFLLDQAKERGVEDLGYDVAFWHVWAGKLPALRARSDGTLPEQTTERLRAAAVRAVESELWNEKVRAGDLETEMKVRDLVRDWRARGYEHVALVAYFNAGGGRDFAYPTAGVFMTDDIEVGVVLAGGRDVESLASVLTHETLHLFGAPDIYRVTPRDPADDRDVMNDACTSLLSSTVGDATAFAIGWRETPPLRKYLFGL